MKESLGEYLKQWRIQKGLSLEVIALNTRIPLPYLRALEENDFSSLLPLQMQESLGEYLKQCRSQKGLSLEVIAQTTRIPLSYLHALEENDFSKLPPAMVIAKAYVRAYSRCLALQEAQQDEVMLRFADLADAIYGRIEPVTVRNSYVKTMVNEVCPHLARSARATCGRIASGIVSAATHGKTWLNGVYTPLVQSLGATYFRIASGIVSAAMLGRTWLNGVYLPLVQSLGATYFRIASGIVSAAMHGRTWLNGVYSPLVQSLGATYFRIASGAVRAATHGKTWLNDASSHLARSAGAIFARIASEIARTATTGSLRGFLNGCHSALYFDQSSIPRLGLAPCQTTGIQGDEHPRRNELAIKRETAKQYRYTGLTGSCIAEERQRETIAGSPYTRRFRVKTWSWVVQYGIAMLLALLLGTILGSIPLFKETTLGDTKLNASRMVQFLGYGSALLWLWLLGRRAAVQLAEYGKGLSFLCHVITPLATLIVISAGYKVLLLLGGPFLDKTGKMVYDWGFVIGMISAALWLTLAWFLKSAPMMESLEVLRRERKSADSQSLLPCPQCGRPIDRGMRFCGHCGTPVV